MKVVLATAPENWMTKAYLPSLGLLYVASYLKQEGHTVALVDSWAEKFTVEQAAEKIVSLEPDAIGVTGTTHNRFNAIQMMQKIRERTDALIFTGGSHFGRAPVDAILNVPAIDVIFREEGEVTSAELLDVYEKGRDLKEVRGLTFRDKDGRVVQTPPREYLKDIDSLPLPDYSLIDWSKYQETYLEEETLKKTGEKTLSIGIVSGRGCPNECIFCTDARFKTFRLRSPAKFVDELEFLKQKYGFRGFDIWDDTFTVSHRHVKEVCEEIRKRGLDIKWYARARVNTINREILQEMKNAGCIIIGYGCESGSQRILNVMRKRITVEQIFDAVKVSHEADFIVRTFWIHSFPSETLYDIKLTLDAMRKVYKMLGEGSAPPHANFSTVYPGTTLEFIAKQEGFLPPDFSWNKPVEFSAPKLLGMDATVPLYEQKNLTVADILSFVYRQNTSTTDVIRKGMRSMRRIKNLNDMKSMTKIGFGYFFGEGGKLRGIKERESTEALGPLNH